MKNGMKAFSVLLLLMAGGCATYDGSYQPAYSGYPYYGYPYYGYPGYDGSYGYFGAYGWDGPDRDGWEGRRSSGSRDGVMIRGRDGGERSGGERSVEERSSSSPNPVSRSRD